MRRIAAVLLLTGAMIGMAHGALAADPVELFDGKSLDGWSSYLSAHGVATSDVWSIADGVLVCKGEPMGYIYTNQKYASYKLVVEWRWPKQPGNSGVLLRIQDPPRPLPKCYEAQLQSGSAGDVYGFQGNPLSNVPAERLVEKKAHPLGGDLMGSKKAQAAEVTAGEWNRFEITLAGDKLTVVLNGQTVNEVTGLADAPGPIGLQSEGGEIHIRKVTLTPLEP